MAQTTNLNVSPYFDDFNADDNYYKVLFKPGLPVQARELTGLQSILQNQIAKFGQHVFKEGAKVIPGNTTYFTDYFCVELNNEYLGITVESYINQLLNRKIVGLTSGVSATIVKILSSSESERDNLTIYIKYDSSGVANDNSKFIDGELFAADVDIVSGPENSSFIPTGEAFASAISTNATSTAASFSVSEGVYFVRGTFVNVPTQTLLLSQYSNTPTGRIGLRILEETINSDEDESLTDNSKGFNNFAAPGADRLKITCNLFFKGIDDLNDDDFVELASVRDGELRNRLTSSDYNLIDDELARRTFAESGDYTTRPFSVSVRESLNDQLGNNGVYSEGQSTEGGAIANEDLALFQVSSGKAFVRGYEIEKTNSSYLDVLKPRTSKTLKGKRINYNTGATLRLNNIKGSPEVGIGNTFVVSLRDQRHIGLPVNSGIATGKEIGLARVYDFALESGSYNATNGNINEYDISLYDVQTFTEVTLNTNHTLSTPVFVEGKFSGATGFLRSSVSNSTSLTLYETQGDIIPNEPLIFNGIENGRVALAITSFGVSDVKSLFAGPTLGLDGNVGAAQSFVSDVVQRDQFVFGDATISVVNGKTGLSTVTSSNPQFPGKLKVGNLVRFGGLNNDLKTLARVVEVGTNSVSITGVATVTGVTEGQLPLINSVGVTSAAGSIDGFLNSPDLTLVTTPIEKSDDNSLFTQLPKDNISDVDISNATLNIRKTFDVTIDASNNQMSAAVSAGTNETFLPFDEERYSLVRKYDGVTEVLTSDKFTFTNGNGSLQIKNVGSDLSADQGATLVATLAKTNPKAKVKRKQRVNTLNITKSRIEGSGTGGTTLNDGLEFGSFPFGTRVQDKKISLNTPDVLKVLGIFESTNTSDASAPKITLSSINSAAGKTTDMIIGEKVRGNTTGAIGIYAERISDTQISFVPLNETDLKENETVTFLESNIQAVVNTIDVPSRNVTFNYKFNSGQNLSFYDYGFIQRDKDADPPSKRLKVYFTNAYFESSDDGDVTIKNSYDSFDYNDDIQTVDGVRNTDVIDIRPRVSNYSVSESTRSPLEFLGRTFNSSGSSASNVLASDESMLVDFSFFLGRVDKIYLTKYGSLIVSQGTPGEDPDKPVPIDDSLEIAEIKLPAYLYDVSDAKLSFLKHKRYRMKDIRKLEERIKNLEYYTSLSLLETTTANLFVTDENGLNKFKSGFFVDNFTSFTPQEESVKIKNSIDSFQKEVRPSHYTNAVDLQLGPVEGQNNIFNGADPEGTNIKKTGNIISLDYDETVYLSQPFGTRSESVTPFILNFWTGSLDLTPASDTWVDTVRLDPKIIPTEGNFSSVVAEAEQRGFDPQTGLTDTVWGGWQTVWTGVEQTSHIHTRNRTVMGRRGGRRALFRETREEGTITRTDIGTSTRQGTRELITETFDQESLGDRTISKEAITIMRSRNITFEGKGFKPQSKLFAFFDGVNVTKYCFPKLIEISMKSGVFQVGETVTGTIQTNFTGNRTKTVKFRVANSNHKEGPFNAPTRVYVKNPYTTSTAVSALETYSGTPGFVQLTGASASVIPSSYSSTSTTLNVDLVSLAEQPQGDFFGNVESGMTLKGETSGAEAEVADVRLISDYASSLQGSFFIPDPNVDANPKFETGKKEFVLIDDDQNRSSEATTFATDTFESSGIIETVQENILSVRNAKVETVSVSESREARRSETTRVDRTVSRRFLRMARRCDPLAQSFFVNENSGVFLTSCEVYFETVDDGGIPVQLDIRTMKLGTPTQEVLPFSQINLDPDQISTSTNGTVATKFTFKSPVYLSPGTEYCICMLSSSAKYRVFISRVGENDLVTDEFVSNQPTLGSLFKSQNASTWEPSQWEDLKFVLNRAEFVSQGTIEIYNPILSEGNKQIPTLMPDSINPISKKIRIGISSAFSGKANDVHPNIGNTISQDNSEATGNLVATAGIATGTLTVSRVGLGYTPANGTAGGSGQTVTGVALTTVTGSGRDAEATVVYNEGSVVSATITGGGAGYSVGDVLGISTDLGINARLTVASIGSTSELVLDNVQGEFAVGSGNLLFAGAVAGVTSAITGAGGDTGAFIPTSGITTVSDGLHILVNHKNHGMHHINDRVTISGVEGDVTPQKLTVSYANDSTAAITVDSVGIFTSFENVAVAATNPGYIKIRDEIIKYTGTSGNTLTGITRQQDSTLAKNYIVGDLVTKYELSGVSLRRINLTHNFSDVTDSNPFTLDSYKVKLDMGANGIGRSTTTAASFPPRLFLDQSKSTGGVNIKATQNMPFQLITPIVQNVTVPGTSLSASIKTVSGTSINDGSGSGADIPFTVQEIEDVALNEINYLNSPRIIASRVNETNNSSITVLPGDRSFNMSLNLNSDNTLLSPVIDTERITAVLTSNRIDKLVSNFATDSRVDTLEDDPSSTQYISKENILETSATSIKIIVDAHVNDYSDVRAFYAISQTPGTDPIFVPFPGFENLNERGQIISVENSNGKPDVLVPSSQIRGFHPDDLQYKELTFTANDLQAFKSFRIKFVMTSTNQAYVPRIASLKVIALA